MTYLKNGVDLQDFMADGLEVATLSIVTYGGEAGTCLQGAGHTVFLEGIDINLGDASDVV